MYSYNRRLVMYKKTGSKQSIHVKFGVFDDALYVTSTTCNQGTGVYKKFHINFYM